MEARTEHPGRRLLNGTDGSRRLVGIDLGTTNSAVAWLDTPAGHAPGRPHLFEIPQLVAAGEIRASRTLPSFLYLPTPEERDGGALALPWDPRPEAIAGVFARDHGSLVPARLAASAKSWLSNPSVDRRARVLPFGADGGGSLSPVEASARLLTHLRDAWDFQFASAGFALRDQEIVLTVPASFDEEARELTVEAARDAGLSNLTLLEEPLAAVYSWIAGHSDSLAAHLSPGHLLLVCDVGGGTTDFSLIRASEAARGIEFERIAIGEHLLLGGDNVDLALAARLERKLADAAPGAPRLALTQRLALQRQASAAKERLLAGDAPDRAAVTLLGTGRAVVGGMLRTELTREEVTATLDEFLPIGTRDERPRRQARRGLRELGLPYESDPAVTRHLAAFLERAASAAGAHEEAGRDGGMLRPDVVLFNGGFFTPAVARERVLDALDAWFGRRPDVLANDAPDAAVAAGAAFYAAIRHLEQVPSRPLIRAGSARAYYIGLQAADGSAKKTAVCVTPRGTQEGTRLDLPRDFIVTTNQPAAFTLFSSTQRDDPIGEVMEIEPDEMHQHAPLVTALRFGQRSRRVPLGVRLAVLYTEVGTLEIWCESKTTEHRWRLQFSLRDRSHGEQAPAENGMPGAAAGADASHAASPKAEESGGETGIVITDEALAEADRLLRSVFGTSPGGPAPEALIGEIERALGHGKHGWPLAAIRRLADTLLGCAEGRRTSPRHEARWLNLTGFCMRPGFGTSLDPWRIAEIRKVYAAGLAHPRDIECQVQWLILWQRVSAGFTTSQQQELASVLVGMLGLGTRKAPRLNPQIFREAWRLLGSLERLDRGRRVKLGDELIAKVRREPQNAALAWAIGRFGARTPLYGGLNAVVPPDTAERWIGVLLTSRAIGPDLAAAIADIGAMTGDPARDVGDASREAALARLAEEGAPPDALRRLREQVRPDRLASARVFGETLPEGLRID